MEIANRLGVRQPAVALLQANSPNRIRLSLCAKHKRWFKADFESERPGSNDPKLNHIGHCRIDWTLAMQ